MAMSRKLAVLLSRQKHNMTNAGADDLTVRMTNVSRSLTELGRLAAPIGILPILMPTQKILLGNGSSCTLNGELTSSWPPSLP